MRFTWLQVPDGLLRSGGKSLAQLLAQATGRKVTRADATMLVIDLWAVILGEIDEDATSMEAELEAKTVVPRLTAEALWPELLGWPAKHIGHLLECLAHPNIGVVRLEGDVVRVLKIQERYSRLAKKQSESRGRARASYFAKEHGWSHRPGTGYVNDTTGEVLPDWRALLARYEKE